MVPTPSMRTLTLTNIGDTLTAQQIADGINTAVAGDSNLAGKITASVDDAGNLSPDRR